MQDFKYFLYKRLARWITCEIKLGEFARLELDSKYQVASFQDVFCSPFYWQLMSFLNRPMNTVLDLGAHLGHFLILAAYINQEIFGEPPEKIFLFEANDCLIPHLKSNLDKTFSKTKSQFKIIQGLVGKKTGTAEFLTRRSNFLASGISSEKGSYKISYVDIEQALDVDIIDVCKCDIEGAEIDFIENYPDLLRRVRIFMVEIHDQNPKVIHQIHSNLEDLGFTACGKEFVISGYTQKIYRNDLIS